MMTVIFLYLIDYFFSLIKQEMYMYVYIYRYKKQTVEACILQSMKMK